jgi:transcriptional regulator of acetoin/glycerol metabolism
VSRAAERLGLDRTTLHRKLKALGLDGDRDAS